jgi:hypothetical protein
VYEREGGKKQKECVSREEIVRSRSSRKDEMLVHVLLLLPMKMKASIRAS